MRAMDLGAGWAQDGASAGDPLDLELVKAHLRVKVTAEDDLIRQYMAAAVSRFQRATGLYLLATPFVLTIDKCPPGADPLECDRGPLLEVTGITAHATSGARTLSVSDFLIDTTRGQISPASGQWPTGLRARQALELEVVLGMAEAAESLDPAVVRTLMELVAWYHRRTGVEPPDSILAPWIPAGVA